VTAVRRALLAAFVVGLAFSLTLSETALALLVVSVWNSAVADAPLFDAFTPSLLLGLIR